MNQFRGRGGGRGRGKYPQSFSHTNVSQAYTNFYDDDEYYQPQDPYSRPSLFPPPVPSKINPNLQDNIDVNQTTGTFDKRFDNSTNSSLLKMASASGFDNRRWDDHHHSSKRRDHDNSGSRGRDQHGGRNKNQRFESKYSNRGRGGFRDGGRGGSRDGGDRRDSNSRDRDRSGSSNYKKYEGGRGSRERILNSPRKNQNRPKKNPVNTDRDLKRSKFKENDNRSSDGERPKKLRKVDSPPDNKEKLDESSELMKKDIEKNLKKTSSPRVSTTTPLIRADSSVDESQKQTFVKVDKTRVLEIPFTKDDYANIGQGKLSSPSRNHSGDEMTILSVQSATPIRKKNVSERNEGGENTEICKTDRNNKQSGSSLVISNSSKFKDSLFKMDNKNWKKFRDNPAQVEPEFRMELQKLIEEHKGKISRKLDENTINSLRESGFCGNDNNEALENLNMDTNDDSVLCLISDWVNKEIPNIDSIIASPEAPETISNPDSSQVPNKLPEPSTVLQDESVDMVIKCEPSALNFDLSDDVTDNEETSSTLIPEDTEVAQCSDNSISTVTSENVEPPKADNNDGVAFAPPNTKRKRGKPKKGQERIIGGTEFVIGPVVETPPSPVVSATSQSNDHASFTTPLNNPSTSSALLDLLPSSTVVTPPQSNPSPRVQSAVPVPTGLTGLSSLSVTRFSTPDDAHSCPIDPYSCNSDDVSTCLSDLKEECDDDTNGNDDTFPHHFLDLPQSNPGPSPGKQAVDDIHELKKKKLKEIFKRESKATQEIQDLDKQIDKLIKERKGKLAELKKIQKEKMNILIA